MLILASKSPRRKEILEMLGYDFKIIVADCDEKVSGLSPEETVIELSKRKALAVNSVPEDTVIGSDTIVSIDNKILGKPKSKDNAFKMLKSLSGRSHTVYTGVTIVSNGVVITDYIASKVYFRDITEREIYEYIATGEPMDKAGAYAVQGKGSAFIEKIDGDFFAVMGLPACYISKELSKLNIFPK